MNGYAEALRSYSGQTAPNNLAFEASNSIGDKMQLLAVLIIVCSVASTSIAQTKSIAELANYRGADREEMLKAGAKKEGRMVWYTSLTAQRYIANIFEAKYPGIKVETYRAGPNDLTRRLLSEAQSKRNIAALIGNKTGTFTM